MNMRKGDAISYVSFYKILTKKKMIDVNKRKKNNIYFRAEN